MEPWFDASGASSLPLGDAHVLSEDALQGVADTLRAQAAGFADPREVEFYVGWAQRLRDRMVTDDIRKCREMHHTHHLVTVMMLAGVASKVDLREVVFSAIRVSMLDPSFRHFFEERLKSHACVRSPRGAG